ncbi:hypothetical protein NE865_12910 [Phthorimaea operculella]|nr:hypothetical protein NE865_12910 [Phthorimaea operculella]
MSLVKLLSAPVKLFQKHVIAFLIVRRHDLGLAEDLIRYISIKPSAPITVLRQKIWHLLDLPDYCDEIIVLKTSENVEIPLTALRKGNEPNRPFILEVWSPVRTLESMTSVRANMLTMGRCLEEDDMTSIGSDKERDANAVVPKESSSTMTEKSLALHKRKAGEKSRTSFSELNKSEGNLRISASSLLFKLQGKKSNNNFANVLLKIQNDLSTLTTKLSSLETKIPA